MKTFILVFFISAVLSACSFNQTENSRKNAEVSEINIKLSLAYLTQAHDALRAKQKLLLAQQQAPDDPAVWYVTGYFLETIGELFAAERAYLHAIKLAPKRGAAHNNYGVFLCKHGRYTQSIQQFLLAVNDPDYLAVTSAYKNAAQCALKIPDSVLANKYFQLAGAINSNI
ncbi:MAG TPA: tetratricopeptide repeat protein [Gammaproteobacteria bacterium]|nr:tetratricopeptide repeat protein [Gammaproteobacteria bacterium]